MLPKSSGDKPKRKLKPKLKLNLPSLVIPQAAPAPSKEIKKEDVANLLRETNAQPKSSFKHADFHDGYQELSQDGYDNQFAGYKISNPVIGDVFIHAIKVDDSRKFSGDKFHISIEQSQLSKGFDSILPLLLSEDSPIDKWKVTDLKSCPSDARVAVGAQVTLYVKADKELGYGSKELKIIKDFVGEIELTLGKNDIPPGVKPKSDVSAATWNFISYRNEHRSDRDGTFADLLAEEPFYKIISD